MSKDWKHQKSLLQEIYKGRKKLGVHEPSRLIAPETLDETWHVLLHTTSALRLDNIFSIEDLHIADIGCGSGRLISILIGLGADPSKISGYEVQLDAFRNALDRLPNSVNLINNFFEEKSRHYDLIFQCTALSSVTEKDLRLTTLSRIKNSLKSNGIFVSLDFYLPLKYPSGIQSLAHSEVNHIFRGFSIKRYYISPGPPALVRKMYRHSYKLARILRLVLPNFKCLTIIKT